MKKKGSGGKEWDTELSGDDSVERKKMFAPDTKKPEGKENPQVAEKNKWKLSQETISMQSMQEEIQGQYWLINAHSNKAWHSKFWKMVELIRKHVAWIQQWDWTP